MLSNDICRCVASTKCELRHSCLRNLDRPSDGERVPYCKDMCIVLVAPLAWINNKSYYIGEEHAIR
jgi:hypothetical protein